MSVRAGPTMARMELPVAGQQPRERADAARNRQRVLAAAGELFRERDPRTVTMEDIAAAAAVGKATLYRRYPDRTAVATALLDEHERELQELVLKGPPPLGPGAPAPERLAAFLGALVRFNEEHGHLLAAVETEAQRLRTGAYAAWRSHVLTLLEEAGVGGRRKRQALADALLGAVGPEVHRYQREVQGLGMGKITAAAQALASALCAPR
jgi:AcrR family transcriptional regulator